MSTLLTDLVRRQTASSLLGVFGRTVDKVAEEMAHDLLRDPEIREQLRALIRAAFDTALAELQQPAPVDDPDERSTSVRVRLDLVEAALRELRATPTAAPPAAPSKGGA